MKIIVLGAGAWGTALAVNAALAEDAGSPRHQVTLWARDAALVAAMQAEREKLAAEQAERDRVAKAEQDEKDRVAREEQTERERLFDLERAKAAAEIEALRKAEDERIERAKQEIVDVAKAEQLRKAEPEPSNQQTKTYSTNLVRYLLSSA